MIIPREQIAGNKFDCRFDAGAARGLNFQEIFGSDERAGRQADIPAMTRAAGGGACPGSGPIDSRQGSIFDPPGLEARDLCD
jgi:hypothetical protein